MIDLCGQRFGNLTVTSLCGGSRGGSRLWNCLCDCGNIAQVSTRHLNRSHNTVRSCGCLKRRDRENHPSWTGYEGISGHWWATHVKRSIDKRRIPIEVDIDIKYAWDLFIAQDKKCAISGIDLYLADDNTNTASVDRIDSSQGYVKGNVQWVHKDVNYMKRHYSMEYFIRFCKLIVEHQTGVCPIR